MSDKTLNDKSPIFIVGASRSGTTMLRLLLNAHPHIAIPNELSYFSSIPEPWLSSWRNVPGSVPEYREFVRNHLFQEETLENVDADALLCRIFDAVSDLDLSVPYRLMLEAYASAEGKVRWGEKTPTNFFYCDILHEMFPDAKFIHLVRDPRAVVRSANNFPRLPDDSLINAANWLHFLENGYKRLTENVPSTQACTIRYEDLTSRPETFARKVCEFINEPFFPCMLEFHEEATSYMPSSIDRLGGDEKVTRPVYTDKQAKWRTDLSEHEIGVVESICRDTMQIFGYELTGTQMHWSRLPLYLLKRQYSAFKRWQHRRERFHLIRYQPLSIFTSSYKLF